MLAEKYDLSESTLRQRAAREHWGEQKNKNRTAVEQKLIDNISDEQADAATECAELINKATKSMLEQIAQEAVKKDLSAYQLDIYSRAVKNLRSVMGIQTKRDAEEQQARIDNLRRQADREDKGDTTVNIIYGAHNEDYGI